MTYQNWPAKRKQFSYIISVFLLNPIAKIAPIR